MILSRQNPLNYGADLDDFFLLVLPEHSIIWVLS